MWVKTSSSQRRSQGSPNPWSTGRAAFLEALSQTDILGDNWSDNLFRCLPPALTHCIKRLSWNDCDSRFVLTQAEGQSRSQDGGALRRARDRRRHQGIENHLGSEVGRRALRLQGRQWVWKRAGGVQSGGHRCAMGNSICVGRSRRHKYLVMQRFYLCFDQRLRHENHWRSLGGLTMWQRGPESRPCSSVTSQDLRMWRWTGCPVGSWSSQHCSTVRCTLMERGASIGVGKCLWERSTRFSFELRMDKSFSPGFPKSTVLCFFYRQWKTYFARLSVNFEFWIAWYFSRLFCFIFQMPSTAEFSTWGWQWDIHM